MCFVSCDQETKSNDFQMGRNTFLSNNTFPNNIFLKTFKFDTIYKANITVLTPENFAGNGQRL
jgi:hypothetical protein